MNKIPALQWQWRYVIQLPLTCVILAFVQGNILKLLMLLLLWGLTFGKLNKPEVIFVASVCLFFTGMNAASLNQGIFSFTSPDILGMPIYEIFMWGFYLLHTRRLIPPDISSSIDSRIWLLAGAYSISFATLKDPAVLFGVTAFLLAIGLYLFHEPLDLSYVAYLILVGAAIEYTGVLSGEWQYPGDPAGGVPIWFVTLWGGVGLFLRRLAGPIMARYPAS